jgi:hypothetical protein
MRSDPLADGLERYGAGLRSWARQTSPSPTQAIALDPVARREISGSHSVAGRASWGARAPAGGRAARPIANVSSPPPAVGLRFGIVGRDHGNDYRRPGAVFDAASAETKGMTDRIGPVEWRSARAPAPGGSLNGARPRLRSRFALPRSAVGSAGPSSALLPRKSMTLDVRPSVDSPAPSRTG